MPLFITYASYSQSGVKGLVDNPSDRAEVIGSLLEKAGAKLIALYMTTGTHDIVLVSEASDGADAVALGMAVASTGSLSNIETVRAWSSSEFTDIAKKAGGLVGSYSPPGS
ncbi:MAG: GYD domain-containing protein [Rhizobiaceae bacterium]